MSMDHGNGDARKALCLIHTKIESLVKIENDVMEKLKVYVCRKILM